MAQTRIVSIFSFLSALSQARLHPRDRAYPINLNGYVTTLTLPAAPSSASAQTVTVYPLPEDLGQASPIPTVDTPRAYDESNAYLDWSIDDSNYFPTTAKIAAVIPGSEVVEGRSIIGGLPATITIPVPLPPTTGSATPNALSVLIPALESYGIVVSIYQPNVPAFPGLPQTTLVLPSATPSISFGLSTTASQPNSAHGTNEPTAATPTGGSIVVIPPVTTQALSLASAASSAVGAVTSVAASETSSLAAAASSLAAAASSLASAAPSDTASIATSVADATTSPISLSIPSTLLIATTFPPSSILATTTSVTASSDRDVSAAQTADPASATGSSAVAPVPTASSAHTTHITTTFLLIVACSGLLNSLL